MLPDGQQIGRYKILSVIKAGGMGEVFLAEDMPFERFSVIDEWQSQIVELRYAGGIDEE